jgi:uncharacterized protein YprB with RNaseH-like and TPR domain
VRKIEVHELISKLKELANELGKTPTLNQFKEHFSRSTIAKHGYNNLVRMAGLEPNMTHVPTEDLIVHAWKARILFLDIETSALLARVWGTFNQNISLNQIEEDWSLLSYAAMFDGEDKVYYLDQRYAPHHTDDRELVEGIHDLIMQCDFICAHNVDFDWGKLNAKFIKYELAPVHPRQICTLKMARKLMKRGITSKKLEFLAKWLGVTEKEKHGKFPGMALWNECLKGNMEAWEEMRIYNIGDIVTLKEVFWKLAKYDTSINFNIYEHQNRCAVCNSDTFVRDGYKVTNTAKKMRFRCAGCGKVYTAKVNEVPRDVNSNLLN